MYVDEFVSAEELEGAISVCFVVCDVYFQGGIADLGLVPVKIR